LKRAPASPVKRILLVDGYVDTYPFPATPTKWTYWMIFRVGDQRVGQWSSEVSLTVSL